MIKKLNPRHLERLLNNKCDVKLYQEGLSEEGEPLTSLDIKNEKCRWKVQNSMGFIGNFFRTKK